MISNYKPRPKDTADISIPKELQPLVEYLAKNVHEVWALNRISEGWTYGDNRDDNKRTHPSLVPYEQLSESERDYDRNTVICTIKFIFKKGYIVTRDNK